MAMKPQPDVLVCDRPGMHEGPVDTFTIGHAGETWEVDLCIPHRRPALDLISHGRETEAKRRRRTFVKTDPMTLIQEQV